MEYKDLLEAMLKLLQLTNQDLRIVSALMTNFIETYRAPAPAAVPLPFPVPQNHPQLHQEINKGAGNADVLNQAAQNEPGDVDVEVVLRRPRPIPESKRPRTKPNLGKTKYSKGPGHVIPNRYHPVVVKRHAIRLRDEGKSYSEIINKIGRLYPKYGFPSIGSVQHWIKEKAQWLDSDSSVNVNNDSLASAAGSNEGDSALVPD